jgi:hypothetical protein
MSFVVKLFNWSEVMPFALQDLQLMLLPSID